jgi:hypothetical protein
VSQQQPDERAGSALIGAAIFALLILAAYHLGAAKGHGQPLPSQPWKHGVAFKLHSREARL